MQFSHKQDTFSQFLFFDLKCILKFKNFEKKKMTLIADVFSRL